MVSEDFYESMGANHPQVGPQGYKRQMVGWIYVVNHYALLHTKYKSYWLHGFRRFFKVFPTIRKLITDPQGMAKLDPRGTVGTIMQGTTRHCYILNLITMGLIVKIFKVFFPL